MCEFAYFFNFFFFFFCVLWLCAHKTNKQTNKSTHTDKHTHTHIHKYNKGKTEKEKTVEHGPTMLHASWVTHNADNNRDTHGCTKTEERKQNDTNIKQPDHLCACFVSFFYCFASGLGIDLICDFFYFYFCLNCDCNEKRQKRQKVLQSKKKKTKKNTKITHRLN